MIRADLFRLSTSLTRPPIFVMHVATSSVGILLVPPSNTMTSSRFETIPFRRLCIPSALAPGQGKQHAAMPRFLSVSRSPCPLTIDAPMIFTLHPRFGAFFCISVSPFCEHFSRLLAFVYACLSSVHSLARGAKALRVSTFIITLSSPFLLSGTRFFTFLFNFLICLLFLTTFPFRDSVNFSSVAVDFDNSSRVASWSSTRTSISPTLSSKSIIRVRKASSSFCTNVKLSCNGSAEDAMASGAWTGVAWLALWAVPPSPSRTGAFNSLWPGTSAVSLVATLDTMVKRGPSTVLVEWASCQIRKIAGCACAGDAGNVFPRRRCQSKPLVSDPGMHHGTCVTHVPLCMSGLLTCGDGKNVPSIPGACAPAVLRIW